MLLKCALKYIILGFMIRVIFLAPMQKETDQMKVKHVMLMMATCLCVLCSNGFGAMMDGVKLEANGETIDVNIGHLVPSVTDWNSDGKKDLLVGQFSDGQIRVYLNSGTDSDPKFGEFSYLQAGAKPISLAAG
jgi:hypothetical protein